MFWLEFVFESYFEVDNDILGERECISGDCDSFILDNIFLRRLQAGAKNVFVCIIVGLCRTVWFRMESADMQQYIL